MTKPHQLIIGITTQKADLETMKAEVFKQTGDKNPFFCPPVKKGEPYAGHVHVFPPFGTSNITISKIEI